MDGLSLIGIVLKVAGAALILASAVLAVLLFACWLGKRLPASFSSLMYAILLPNDWTKALRKEGVVFCSEVWYDIPVAAQWMTLDRWGAIQCWQACPTYCPEDGEWYSHPLNRPFDLGYTEKDWYLPHMKSAVPPLLALPDDIYETSEC